MSYTKNAGLGLEIYLMLIDKKIETPMTSIHAISSDSAFETIKGSFGEIMNAMGLDLRDDSLIDTPKRVAKLFTREFFYGLDYNNFPECTVVENKFDYDHMVMERNIQVYSNCEHHFLPIIGGATVAYIPNKKVLGLSKLNRIVDFFSRRPQIQERLTEQIHATLSFILDTEDVAVVIDAEHMCVKLRGVEDACSDTVTSKLSGKFRDGSMRAEFFQLMAAKRRGS